MYGVVCKLRMAPMLSSQDICSTRDRWIRESIKRIHIQFWAVLGSQGCTEKKNTNFHKYATFEVSFFMF